MRGDPVTQAAEARSNLNIFHAVIAILEGGTICASASAQRTCNKIITLCQQEAARQLKAYDQALERARR